MTITEIYEKYQIMPNVREHQLRVAAVGKLIAQQKGLKVDDIVITLLLHDMGKLVVFKLNEVERQTYETVQTRFKEKYGSDPDEATYKIAEEIGVSESVMTLLKAVGFAHAIEVNQDGTLEQKVCLYADQRINRNGVVSLQSRFDDGRRRFIEREGFQPEREALFEDRVTAIRGIESTIFEGFSLRPERITYETINGLVEELVTFNIPQPKLIT